MKLKSVNAELRDKLRELSSNLDLALERVESNKLKQGGGIRQYD